MKTIEQDQATTEIEKIKVTGPHQKFARELVAMTGFSSLEEVYENRDSITFGEGGKSNNQGRALDRLEQISGKDIKDEGEKCQLCHTEIKNQCYIRVNGVAVDQFIGTQCSKKLLQFLETRTIQAVSKNKRVSEFNKLVKGLLPEGDRAEIDTNNFSSDKPKARIENIVASMLTWLEVYFENHPSDETKELSNAVTNMTRVGYYPNKVIAEKVVEFYNKVRTFDTLNKLDSQELQDFQNHPHKGMLGDIFTIRRTTEELNRIRRILAQGYLRSLDKKTKEELRSTEISREWEDSRDKRQEERDSMYTPEYLSALQKAYADSIDKDIQAGVETTIEEERKDQEEVKNYLLSIDEPTDEEVRSSEIAAEWETARKERQEAEDKKYTPEYIVELEKAYGAGIVQDIKRGVEETIKEEKEILGAERLRSLIHEGVIRTFPEVSEATIKTRIIGQNEHLLKKYSEAFNQQLAISEYIFEIRNDDEGKPEYHYYAHNVNNNGEIGESAIDAIGREIAFVKEYRNGSWWYLHLYTPVILVDENVFAFEDNGDLTPIDEFFDRND